LPPIKRYLPDGSTRALWAKPHARVYRRHEVLPCRGSHVIAITDGPRRGLFMVDFSPLAEATGDDQYRVCLAQTYESHEDAVEAEHAWLVENWVLA
jgi:hypothetical protein